MVKQPPYPTTLENLLGTSTRVKHRKISSTKRTSITVQAAGKLPYDTFLRNEQLILDTIMGSPRAALLALANWPQERLVNYQE